MVRSRSKDDTDEHETKCEEAQSQIAEVTNLEILITEDQRGDEAEQSTECDGHDTTPMLRMTHFFRSATCEGFDALRALPVVPRRSSQGYHVRAAENGEGQV